MGFTEIELVLYFVKALILVKCVALGFTYHIKKKNFVYKKAGIEPIHKKYKANKSTRTHFIKNITIKTPLIH
jgi:hypothetical protein